MPWVFFSTNLWHFPKTTGGNSPKKNCLQIWVWIAYKIATFWLFVPRFFFLYILWSLCHFFHKLKTLKTLRWPDDVKGELVITPKFYPLPLFLAIRWFDSFGVTPLRSSLQLVTMLDHDTISDHQKKRVPSWELTYPLPSLPAGTFEDGFPFPKVGCVGSLEGNSIGVSLAKLFEWFPRS